MKPVKIALAGVGGYANYVLGLLLNYIPPEQYEIVGIADPFVEKAPRIQYFREQNIPLYDTVEALFSEQTVDALYIASPISFHKHQCQVALKQGCVILCEKPLTATYEDTIGLQQQAAAAKIPLGVGFQWSYAPSILAAKRDILAGKYGRPLTLRAYISWQRFDDYYENSSWKGKIRDNAGQPIYDSVLTNATAHYAHNIFFIMGQRLEASEMPIMVKGSVYRAKSIETFDSCFLKGQFSGGAQFLFLATHSGDVNTNPIVEYQFEKGTIRINTNTTSPTVEGTLEGAAVHYGGISTPESDSWKLKALLDAAREGTPFTCPIEAVLPHQTVCRAVFSQLSVQEFPKELLYRTDSPGGQFVRGLCDDLCHCFETLQTPEEAGCSWAVPDKTLTLSEKE